MTRWALAACAVLGLVGYAAAGPGTGGPRAAVDEACLFLAGLLVLVGVLGAGP